jgi:hypothetical protein
MHPYIAYYWVKAIEMDRERARRLTRLISPRPSLLERLKARATFRGRVTQSAPTAA